MALGGASTSSRQNKSFWPRGVLPGQLLRPHGRPQIGSSPSLLLLLLLSTPLLMLRPTASQSPIKLRLVGE
eukprot:scaffold23642_cov15-Prasinocladus_malaysianus.AAC.1